MRDGRLVRGLATVGLLGLISGALGIVAHATTTTIMWPSNPTETPQSTSYCTPNALALADPTAKPGTDNGGNAGSNCGFNPSYNGKPYLAASNLHNYWSEEHQRVNGVADLVSVKWPILGTGLIQAFNDNWQTWTYYADVVGGFGTPGHPVPYVHASGWQRIVTPAGQPEPSMQGNGQTPGPVCRGATFPPCQPLRWSSFGLTAINAHVTIWIGAVASGSYGPDGIAGCYGPGFTGHAYHCWPEGQMLAPEQPHGSQGLLGTSQLTGSAVTDIMLDWSPPPPVTSLTVGVSGRTGKATWMWPGELDQGNGLAGAFYVSGVQGYDLYQWMDNSPNPTQTPQLTCLYPPPGLANNQPIKPKSCKGTLEVVASVGTTDELGPMAGTLTLPQPPPGMWLHGCIRAVDWVGNAQQALTCDISTSAVLPVPTVVLRGGGSIELGQPGPTAFSLQGRAYDGTPSDQLVLQLCEPVIPGPCDYQATRTYAPGQYVITPVVGIPAGMVIPAGGGLELTGQLQLVSLSGKVLASSGTVAMYWNAPIIGLSANPSTLPSGHTTTITANLLSPTPEDGWTVDFRSAEPGANAISCTIPRGQASCSIRIARTVTTTTTYTIGGHLVSYPLASATTPVTWTVKGTGGCGVGCGNGPACGPEAGVIDTWPPPPDGLVFTPITFAVVCPHFKTGLLKSWTTPHPPKIVCTTQRVRVYVHQQISVKPPKWRWEWEWQTRRVCRSIPQPPYQWRLTQKLDLVDWHFGDGSGMLSSDLGRPYPSGDVLHTYTHVSSPANSPAPYPVEHNDTIPVTAQIELLDITTRDGQVMKRQTITLNAGPTWLRLQQTEGVAA